MDEWSHECCECVERLRAENAEHLLRAESLRAELARCQAECEYLEGELEMERG